MGLSAMDMREQVPMLPVLRSSVLPSAIHVDSTLRIAMFDSVATDLGSVRRT